jgi:hypothetical protein
MKAHLGVLLYLHMGTYVPVLREAFPVAQNLFKVVWPLVKQEEQRRSDNKRIASFKKGLKK